MLKQTNTRQTNFTLQLDVRLRLHSRHYTNARPLLSLANISHSPDGLIALEIVAAGGMTEVGPALGAPIFDKSCFSGEGLETLGFAHLRVSRMPEMPHLEEELVAGFDIALERVERAQWSTDIEVDEVHIAQVRICLRHSPCWGGPQDLHRGIDAALPNKARTKR